MVIKFCWGESFDEKSAFTLESFSYDLGTVNPGVRSDAIPEGITMRVLVQKDSEKGKSGQVFVDNAKQQLAMRDDTKRTSGVIRVYEEAQISDASLHHEVIFKKAWITDIRAELSRHAELPMVVLVVVRPKVIIAHGVTLELFDERA